jgi:hypothetical protein
VIKRCLILFFIFTSFLGIVYSLDFDISPNDDGSLDFLFGFDWEYNNDLYSGIDVEYKNIKNQNETNESFVSTSGKSLSFGTDILGKSFRSNNFTYNIALNTKWDNMQIREIGYIDDTSDTRFFILNDRVLNLFLPRIKGNARYQIDPLLITIGGEYAPWLWVSLDQELTINPGLPEKTYHSEQSATNAFSLNSKIKLKNEIISPEVFVEYDQLAIEYGAYTAGGEIEIDTLMQDLTVVGTLVLGFIDLKEIHPSFSFGYSWSWTTDLSVENAEAELEKDYRIMVGFQF